MANRPLPRLQLSLRSRKLLLRPFNGNTLKRPINRHASTNAPVTDKSRILERPDKFRPPSHGRRLRRTRQPSYGAPLSEIERAAQGTRRYPNMMPPEGTFMHWFLTNRGLHLWITLGTLTILTGFTMMHSFLHSTAYRDSLPSQSDLLYHPFASISQFLSVYKLHVEHESAKVDQKRQKKLEDVQKRQEFKKAHGVDPGFLTGSWLSKLGTVEQDAEKEKKRKEQEAEHSDLDLASPVALEAAVDAPGEGRGSRGEEADQLRQRRERRPVKKWFGIW